MRNTHRLVIALVFLLLPGIAMAQQAPPKQIADEPVVEPEVSSEAVSAAFYAKAGVELASEIAQYQTEQTGDTVTGVKSAGGAVEADADRPSGAQDLSNHEDQEVMEKLEAELETAPVQVNEEVQRRREELRVFVEHVQGWNLVDDLTGAARGAWSKVRTARKARLAAPGEGMFDLRPYVDDPKWAEAIRLLEENDCRDALKLAATVAPKNPEPGVEYAIARMQMCAGEGDEGRKTLKRLAKDSGVIGYLAKVRLGSKTKDDLGRTEGMYLSERVRGAKAKARVNVDGALKDLDTLHDEMISSWDRYRCRLAQAEILVAAKRIDEAGEAYLSLYRSTRGWKINSSIEDRIESLERRHNKKFLTYGERIDRMRHLVARGRYKEARKVSIENAKIRRVKGNEIRGWAKYRKALQAEREKKRDEANRLFAAAEKMVKDSEVRPRLYFGWARSLRRTNKDGTAIQLYDRLCKEFPEHHLCDDALYEAGRLLQFKNKHAEAEAKFTEVIEKHPDSEFMADALWRSAFSHYLQGNYKTALLRLNAIVKDHSDLKDESELSMGLKAKYWIAMCHLKSGDKPSARTAFQTALDDGKLTWYGRLAAARMKQQGWVPRLQLPDGRLRKDDLEDLALLQVPQSTRLAVASEYVRIGLLKDALAELKDQTAIHPVPEGAYGMLGAVHLARGDAAHAHWVMKKQISEAGPDLHSLRDWGTAFPLNFMDLSKKYGKQAGVSPFLVQSIMRQESGFRPAVKSWAGAMGLMQMMPRSANWTAKIFLNGKKYSKRQLLKPEVSVEIGSMYIRVHTAHTQESIPLALAGYNAGAGALESWYKRYGDRDLDAFVESITYQEARGYVRKVYTTYVAYSFLYGGNLPELDLKLPKKLRRFGDVPETKPRVSMR